MRSSDRIMARHRGSIQFSNRDMDFTFNYLLGQADLLTGHGPLFATAQRIRGASPSAWRREFGRLADHAHRQTTAAHAAGDTTQARLWALTDCYANRSMARFPANRSATGWTRVVPATVGTSAPAGSVVHEIVPPVVMTKNIFHSPEK